MLKPILPPYDIGEWRQMPYAEKLKLVCQSWAMQGYGTPPLVYTVYILKIAFYVGVWLFFCSLSPALGGPATIGEWWAHPLALQKAVLWSMVFEIMGFGCGSGPLTGRYIPPVGGFLYFLRPGTTKMPFFAGAPIIGRDTRSFLDVLLYAGFLALVFRALMAPALTWELVVPVVVLLPILGLFDKTLFLAARSEHYWTASVAMLFAGQFLPAAKVIWVAIWWGAATSKLNHHFPSVVTVMISNSPLTQWGPIRRWMYQNYPEDLRPSNFAKFMAHAGTVVEYSFPLVLLLSGGGTLTWVTLCVMLGFHIFITSNIPMGVPIEWNVIMVYGGFVLFGAHPAVSIAAISSPLLIAVLVGMLVVLPVVGNFWPQHVSFLMSMRYYAGNWAYSVWLFEGDACAKLDRNLVKFAPRIKDQLAFLYDEDTCDAIVSKVMAFRAMHLHGRALQFLVPRAIDVDRINDYEYLDGELVAGVALGWNFGAGHLHNLQLMESLQRQCGFEPGELRCIFVESTPMLSIYHQWTIADAAEGVLERGEISTREMLDLQPWGTGQPEPASMRRGEDVEGAAPA